MPTLHSLPDQEILDRTRALVANERKLTLSVLLYLNEIESRQLHLKLGHGSLFDYCTTALGYSSSAAWRRIQTARCVAKFPVIYGMLERNEVNLSTISQVSRVMDHNNHEQLLSRISRKSQREVETILAEYQEPVHAVHRARTVVMRVPSNPVNPPGGTGATPGLFQCSAAPMTDGHNADEVESTGAFTADARVCEKSAYCRNGSESASSEESSIAAQLQKRVMLQFSVHSGFMPKLERVRTVAWYRLPPRASFEQIFEFLLDEFIERHDPSSKQRRREQKHKGAATVSEPPPPPGKRYVPAAVRDHIFQRDKGRCTFVGAAGIQCQSTLALQVDHVVPVALGGASTPDNLRLLCGKHNRLEAERVLGRTTNAQQRKDTAMIAAETSTKESRREDSSVEDRRRPPPR